MSKFKYFLILGVLLSACLRARAATPLDEIMSNMGNIGLNGLPNLSFDIVERSDLGELASLGFRLRLVHRISLRHGRTAKTEWSIPSLQTHAFINTQGDVEWLTTNGRVVRFRKGENGYKDSSEGASIRIVSDGEGIDITTRAYVMWRYRHGFLDAISTLRGNYRVVTDHGTITSITKSDQDHNEPVLTCTYSNQGLLDEVKLGSGKKISFQWTRNNSLSVIRGVAGTLFEFEYTDSLLGAWRANNGPLCGLKWLRLDQIRDAAFETPPVVLVEDAVFTYTWDHDDRIDIVKIRTKAGVFVSQTRIGPSGLVQLTPNGIITYWPEKQGKTNK